MKVIPLNTFCSFKKVSNDIILLFNKEIKNKLKKNNNLKKNQNILNIFLNKVNTENYLTQCKRFLAENFINKDKFNYITTEFYKKIISESNFTDSYLLFYKTIIENYYNESKYDFSYMINLVESKFKMDFENKKVLLESVINNLTKIPNDINQKESCNYIKSYKINNLRLIYSMIKNKVLSDDIISYIYDTLNSDTNIEFLYEFLKLTKDIQFINNLDISKYNLRFQTLFKELKNSLNKKDTNNNKSLSIKKPKFSNKILITNIIEEYLFNDEIDEVKVFIENYILKKNLQVVFVETALTFGKNNNNLKDIENMLELVKHTLKKKPISKYKSIHENI